MIGQRQQHHAHVAAKVRINPIIIVKPPIHGFHQHAQIRHQDLGLKVVRINVINANQVFVFIIHNQPPINAVNNKHVPQLPQRHLQKPVRTKHTQKSGCYLILVRYGSNYSNFHLVIVDCDISSSLAISFNGMPSSFKACAATRLL